MAGSRLHRKRPSGPPVQRGRVQSAASAAVRAKVAFAVGSCQRDHELPLLVESDLSGDMAVEDRELDAIIRLLGGALDDILSGTGGEYSARGISARRNGCVCAPAEPIFSPVEILPWHSAPRRSVIRSRLDEPRSTCG